MMNQHQVLERLDGHVMLSPETAREVCAVLDVPFPEEFILSWQTTQEAWERYGFVATIAPGQGVDGLALSYHVCSQLGIDPPGRHFVGKGFQSKANGDAIKKRLDEFQSLHDWICPVPDPAQWNTLLFCDEGVWYLLSRGCAGNADDYVLAWGKTLRHLHAFLLHPEDTTFITASTLPRLLRALRKEYELDLFFIVSQKGVEE